MNGVRLSRACRVPDKVKGNRDCDRAFGHKVCWKRGGECLHAMDCDWWDVGDEGMVCWPFDDRRVGSACSFVILM